MKSTNFLLFCLVAIIFISCQNTPSPTNEATPLADSTSTFFQEPHRPQFHFSPKANWMNDPNGMVYYDGEYHLFFQYYPEDIVWGPMHWGHAVSKDLVHWEHLPIALYPDSLGYIFSGSAVIDWKNTSGLGENNQPPMIAIFTHHDPKGERAQRKDFQYQSITYSNDKGRTWTKYKGNPVLSNPGIKDFRDPKVIWHEATQQWVMVLAVYDRAHFYTSPNLKDWTFASEFGIKGDTRLWECPDLFPMKVEESGATKWVLITSIQKEGPNGGTATAYFVGDFDGKIFTGDPAKQYWADYGTDNYAMVTWSDVPGEDGRRLALGWMSNWQYAQEVPTEKWRSAMTLTRALSLHQNGDNFQLCSLPVKELKTIEGPAQTINQKKYTNTTLLLQSPTPLQHKITLRFTPSPNAIAGLRFSNTAGEKFDLLFNTKAKRYEMDRRAIGQAFNEHFQAKHFGEASYELKERKMLVYIDHSSIELFGDDGRCVMTDLFFAQQPLTTIELLVEQGELEVLAGGIISLRGIWD